MLRALEARDVVEAERIERSGRHGFARARHDEGHHLLAPFGVELADNGALEHGRVAQQHLLNLARIDVHAARDDHVLRAILERQEAIFIEAADIAGVEPAALEGGRVGLGVLPVAGHDDFAPHAHLAGLAGWERVVVLIDDLDLNAGARESGRAQALAPFRVRALLVQRLRQIGDGHRAFALRIDLQQARAEHVEPALDVRHIGRAAAIVDRLQVGEVGVRDRRAVHGAHQHGRRGEHRAAAIMLDQIDQLAGLEALARRHHVHRGLGDVRQAIEARAVRHRRRVNDRIGRLDPIHVGEIGERHRHQIAMRERRALGPPGGAAGVEDPGRPIGRHVLKGLGLVRHERAPALVAHDDIGDARQLARHGLERRRQIRPDDADLGAAVLEDVGEFLGVEPRVHRHRGEAAMPRTPDRLVELGPVGHREADAIAGREAEARPKRGAERGRGVPIPRIVRMHVGAERERGALRKGARAVLDQNREVHGKRA